MASTTDEKKKALIKLLGREMAEAVFKQADLTEKQAVEMGLKYKERRAAAAPFSDAPRYLDNPQNGIGTFLHG